MGVKTSRFFLYFLRACKKITLVIARVSFSSCRSAAPIFFKLPGSVVREIFSLLCYLWREIEESVCHSSIPFLFCICDWKCRWLARSTPHHGRPSKWEKPFVIIRTRKPESPKEEKRPFRTGNVYFSTALQSMTDYDLVVFLIEPTNRFFFFFFFIYLTWHFTIKEWSYRVSTAMRYPPFNSIYEYSTFGLREPIWKGVRKIEASRTCLLVASEAYSSALYRNSIQYYLKR